MGFPPRACRSRRGAGRRQGIIRPIRRDLAAGPRPPPGLEAKATGGGPRGQGGREDLPQSRKGAKEDRRRPKEKVQADLHRAPPVPLLTLYSPLLCGFASLREALLLFTPRRAPARRAPGPPPP